MGQVPDAGLVPAGFATDSRGRIGADRETSAAGPGLFAAGDAVSGASTVVEALAAGKKAAEAAARYLRDEDVEAQTPGERPTAAPPPKEKLETLERMERTVRGGRGAPEDMLESHARAVGASSAAGSGTLPDLRQPLEDRLPGRLPGVQAVPEILPDGRYRRDRGALLGSLHSWNVVELGR